MANQTDFPIAQLSYDGISYQVIAKEDKFLCTQEHEFGFGKAKELGEFAKVEFALLFFTNLVNRMLKVDG